MRFDLRLYNTGLGELLCLALAWAIGATVIWADYARSIDRSPGDKVAVSGAAPASNADFD